MSDGHKSAERQAIEALAKVPDDIASAGLELYQRAVRRSKQKGISVRAAFKEIAEELPEPLRSAALDVVASHAPHGKSLA